MASIKQVMTLLSKAGIKNELKQQMVYNLTHGRTTSVRGLNQHELKALVNKLNNTNTEADQELVKRRKRSVILKLATETGIKEPDSWTKFNAWMLKSSIHKKALKMYDYDELDGLSRQFRALKRNYENSAIKTGTKAWHHATGIPEISAN